VKVGTTGLSEDLRKGPGRLQGDFTDEIPTAMCNIYHEILDRGKEYLRGLMTSCGSLHPLCGQHDVGCAHQRQVFNGQPALKNSFASTVCARPTRCRTTTLPTDENFHVQPSLAAIRMILMILVKTSPEMRCRRLRRSRSRRLPGRTS
jgi:hypothetical protein